MADVLQKAAYTYTNMLQVPQNRELSCCVKLSKRRKIIVHFTFFSHDFELQSAFQWEKAFANQGISLLF